MSKILFVFAIFAILALVLMVAYINSSEWNKAALGSRNFIESGSKFGMYIGEPKTDVIDRLKRRGLEDITDAQSNLTNYNPQRCHAFTYPNNYEVQIWFDGSWRYGVICVAFKDDKLARLSWDYGMFMP